MKLFRRLLGEAGLFPSQNDDFIAMLISGRDLPAARPAGATRAERRT